MHFFQSRRVRSSFRRVFLVSQSRRKCLKKNESKNMKKKLGVGNPGRFFLLFFFPRIISIFSFQFFFLFFIQFFLFFIQDGFFIYFLRWRMIFSSFFRDDFFILFFLGGDFPSGVIFSYPIRYTHQFDRLAWKKIVNSSIFNEKGTPTPKTQKHQTPKPWTPNSPKPFKPPQTF